MTPLRFTTDTVQVLASPDSDRPVEYERDELAADIAYLAQFAQKAMADELVNAFGSSQRGTARTACFRTLSQIATALGLGRGSFAKTTQ